MTRFDAANPKLAIWLRNERTDHSATKGFNRGGGFKGTSTNATYTAKRLTDEFGPVGKGWGVEVEADDLLTGAPMMADGQVVGHEIVHRVRVRFWWMDGEERRSFVQFGQTAFVGKNKNGFFTDEEAPKKSLTDAMTKAASWLGFAADVHLGLFDDNKYVAERQAEAAPPPKAEWVYVSARDGKVTPLADKEAWRKEWGVRIHGVEHSGNPVEAKVRMLNAMLDANKRALDDLHNAGEQTIVAEIDKGVSSAIERLNKHSTQKEAA